MSLRYAHVHIHAYICTFVYTCTHRHERTFSHYYVCTYKFTYIRIYVHVMLIQAMINEVAKLSIVSLSSQALIPLQHAVKTSTFPLKGQIIPVKCGVSGSCDPVIEEEKVININGKSHPFIHVLIHT